MGEDGDGGRAAANQQYTGGTGLVRGPNPAALIKLPTVMNCSTRNERIVYARSNKRRTSQLPPRQDHKMSATVGVASDGRHCYEAV